MDLTDAQLGRLAIFPLPGAVLFPHATIPLHVFEPRYRALVEDCMLRDAPLAIWRIDEEAVSTPSGPALSRVATAGRIGAHQPMPHGTCDIIVEGLARVVLESESDSGEPWRVVRARRHPLEDVDAPQVRPRVDTLRRLGSVLALRHPRAARLLQVTIDRCPEPGELSDVICAITHDDPGLRQELLETSSVPARLDKVIETLGALMLEEEAEPEDSERM